MRLITTDTPYTNAAGDLRVVIEHDPDPADPRRDHDPLGHLVAKHRRYTLGDEDAEEKLRTALQALAETRFGADADIECASIACHSCGGDGEWDDGRECNNCGGSGEIESPHYVDVSDAAGLYRGLATLDPDEEAIFHLPVYLYDHSGITLNTTGFSCQWDSGQLGFIWITREAVIQEGLWYAKDDWPTEKLREVAHRCLKGEVEAYATYLRGEVYGFTVQRLRPRPDDWEAEEWAAHDVHWQELDSCWGFFGLDLIQCGILDHLDDAAVEAICYSEGLTRAQLDAEVEAWVATLTPSPRAEGTEP